MRIVYYRTLALGWVTTIWHSDEDFPWFDALPQFRNCGEWIVPGTHELELDFVELKAA